MKKKKNLNIGNDITVDRYSVWLFKKNRKKILDDFENTFLDDNSYVLICSTSINIEMYL